MPRLSALSLPALDELARQLRFAPPARAAEVIGRAIALARELDPDRSYPEDWLVHRLTGYTPDAGGVAVAVGSAIRRDLSAFCERVSHRAGLSEEDIGGALPLDALARRWSVSARTLERYRREGLIAVRLTGPAGERVMFPARAVEWFEAAHAETLSRAASRTRLTPAQRDRLVRAASRARRRFGWSLNETARRLAQRTGRSHEGVRQALLRAEPGGRAAITRGDRRRRVIFRALRAGIDAHRLAERFGKSADTIRRIGLEERLAVLRETAPASVGPAAEAGALETPIARAGLLVPVERTLGEWVEIAGATPPPARDEERPLAEALAALVARVWAGLADERRPTAGRTDRIETDLRWAGALARRLAASQRGFILHAVEARLGGPALGLTPAEARGVHRAVMDAAVAAVWRFRAVGDRRLAGVTGVAVDRAVSAWLAGRPAPRATGRARSSEAPLDDWARRLGPWQPWLDPHPFVLRGLGRVDEAAREIVTRRFGLAGAAPLTIEETARALGVSARAVSRALVEAQRAGASR